MSRIQLSNAERQILVELYGQTRKTVDDLPYSEEFEALYTNFIARSERVMTRHDVWRALASQRKASRFVHKER